MMRKNAYFETENGPANFSLLYPKVPGESSNQQNMFLELNPDVAHDLGLDEIIAAFTSAREYQREIQPLFHRLPRDPNVILYRQAVLDDLLANPELADRLISLLPVINSLFEYSQRASSEMSWLHEVVRRAEELQHMIDCFEGMGQILDTLEGMFHSEGLRSLQGEIRKAQNDPMYQSLLKELPVMLSKLQGIAILVG